MRQVMPHRNNIGAQRRPLQVFSSSNGQSLTEFEALWHSGQDLSIAIQTRIMSLYQWYKTI